MPLSSPKVFGSPNRLQLINEMKRSDHAEKMHQLPDEYLADALPIAKKIARAQGLDTYNILQVCPDFQAFI